MSYTSSYNDYTKLSTYLEKQQWGPKENMPIPPPMNIPIIPEYQQNYGINTLSHGYNGVGYYTIETGYGQKNQCTTFNLASCPSNRPIAPFTKKEISSSPSSVESYVSGGQEVHVFIKNGCPFCTKFNTDYLPKLRHFPNISAIVHDIDIPEESTLFQKLGGTGVPFFYSSKTKQKFQGLPKSLPQLLNALHLLATAPSSSTPSHSMSPSHASDPVKDLLIQIVISNSCRYCHQLVNMLKQHGLIDKVKVWESSDPNAQELIRKYSVRGFPFVLSLKTNKYITGAPRSVDQLIAALS